MDHSLNVIILIAFRFIFGEWTWTLMNTNKLPTTKNVLNKIILYLIGANKLILILLTVRLLSGVGCCFGWIQNFERKKRGQIKIRIEMIIIIVTKKPRLREWKPRFPSVIKIKHSNESHCRYYSIKFIFIIYLIVYIYDLFYFYACI